MIILLNTNLKLLGFFCVDTFLKTLIRMERFLFFLSVFGKAWFELWHSGHNGILTSLSQCPTSGYFKNHWRLELFLKYHQGSQNVSFFYLGSIISVKCIFTGDSIL